MDTEERIRDILSRSKFGLTKEEIASRAGISEATSAKLLENMASSGRIARTRAGKAVFYKIFLAVPFFILICATVNAVQLTSTSFNLSAETMNAGGGDMSSNTYHIVTSIGQISNSSSSVTYNVCAGFLCNFLEFITGGKITFLLEFNISGNANDTSFVDNNTAYRLYRPSDIVNYYACIHDTSINNTPVFGIIAAGSLNYINLSSGNSSVLRVSQDITGNNFILPITSGNCTILNTRMSQVALYGTIFQPFIIPSDIANAVELVLSYPAIDIEGSFEKSGSFTMTVEKNETNDKQIIIKPV